MFYLQYLETTADILEALMRDDDVEAVASVDGSLRQLQAHQVDVGEYRTVSQARGRQP